jgi:hypothetical protein
MFRKLNPGAPLRILRVLLILCFILFAVAVRILPHPWNFTPIGAMALFSGAKLNNKWAAFLMPLSALFLGDIFVGFYKLRIVIYLSFGLSVLIGRYVRGSQTFLPLSAATLLGAIQFFLVTNLAIWFLGYTLYPKSPAGLVACYVLGIPFFANSLAGDAFYAAILFGGFAIVERLSPAFRADEPSLADWA